MVRLHAQQRLAADARPRRQNAERARAVLADAFDERREDCLRCDHQRGGGRVGRAELRLRKPHEARREEAVDRVGEHRRPADDDRDRAQHRLRKTQCAVGLALGRLVGRWRRRLRLVRHLGVGGGVGGGGEMLLLLLRRLSCSRLATAVPSLEDRHLRQDAERKRGGADKDRWQAALGRQAEGDKRRLEERRRRRAHHDAKLRRGRHAAESQRGLVARQDVGDARLSDGHAGRKYSGERSSGNDAVDAAGEGDQQRRGGGAREAEPQHERAANLRRQPDHDGRKGHLRHGEARDADADRDGRCAQPRQVERQAGHGDALAEHLAEDAQGDGRELGRQLGPAGCVGRR